MDHWMELLKAFEQVAKKECTTAGNQEDYQGILKGNCWVDQREIYMAALWVINLAQKTGDKMVALKGIWQGTNLGKQQAARKVGELVTMTE